MVSEQKFMARICDTHVFSAVCLQVFPFLSPSHLFSNSSYFYLLKVVLCVTISRLHQNHVKSGGECGHQVGNN